MRKPKEPKEKRNLLIVAGFLFAGAIGGLYTVAFSNIEITMESATLITVFILAGFLFSIRAAYKPRGPSSVVVELRERREGEARWEPPPRKSTEIKTAEAAPEERQANEWDVDKDQEEYFFTEEAFDETNVPDSVTPVAADQQDQESEEPEGEKEAQPEEVATVNRYRPSDNELDAILIFAEEETTTPMSREAERLIDDAGRRSEDLRCPEDYLVLATRSWREKDFENALQFTSTGMSLNPQNHRVQARLLYRMGRAYQDLGVLTLAVKNYRKALECDRQFFHAQNNLGRAYLLQKNYEAGEKAFKEAIALNIGDPGPHYHLGNLYYDQKNYFQAEKEFKEAVRLNPDHVKAHYRLGNLFLERRKYDEAEKSYKKLVKLDPGNVKVRNRLGNVYRAQKKYDNAEKEFRKALKLDPNDAASHYNLGTFYVDQKQYDEAVVEFKKAVKLDPKKTAAHNFLGNIYATQKNYAEAEKHYQRVLEIEPENVQLHNNLAQVYFNQQKFDDAEQLYKAAQQLDPENLKAQVKLEQLAIARAQQKQEQPPASEKKSAQ